MNKLHASALLLAVCCLSSACCADSVSTFPDNGSPSLGRRASEGLPDLDVDPSQFQDEMSSNADANDVTNNYDKRVERYAFGLGRRAYMYTNGGVGMKRLPVYNFGLGKRSRPYSFGLGKRNDDDFNQQDNRDYIDNELDRSFFGGDNNKRNKPYSFGLGKRQPPKINARTQPYGFGLGKR